MSDSTNIEFNDAEYAKLDNEVSHLSFLSRRLRILGLIAFCMSFLNITTAIFIVFFADSLIFRLATTVFTLSIIPCMITIAILGIYDQSKRRGDALFEEISDQLQWHIARRYSKSEQEGHSEQSSYEESTSPVFHFRITLRLFASAIKLPFTPGPNGAAIYVVVNLLIVVALSVFYIWSRRFL